MADVASWIAGVMRLGGIILVAAVIVRGWVTMIVVIRRTIFVFLILVIKQCSSQEPRSTRQVVAKLPRLRAICQHKVGTIELVQRVLNARLWDGGWNRGWW